MTSIKARRGSGRALRLVVALCVIAVTSVVVGAGVRDTAAGAAAAPSCRFSVPSFASVVVVDATPGEVINVQCSGFPVNNPYLLVESSLLVAIDPLAKPLLTGQATSLPGVLAIIAALPEMNVQSILMTGSDASGNLNYNYTLPTSQPLDPNATCPPTTQELNSGLIGCAVAMIDLTTFKPVVAGTFVVNYKGQPFLPPGPTLALSPGVASPGQSVSVGDAPGAKTFWWLATLVSVYANLGGSGGGGPVPVVVRVGGRKTASNAAVASATYNGALFTPPKLSGSFLVKGRGGRKNVFVSLTATLLGIPFQLSATAPLRVIK